AVSDALTIPGVSDDKCTIYDDGTALAADDTVKVAKKLDNKPGEKTLTYTCTVDGSPSTGDDGTYQEGSNTATVTWDGTDYSSDAVDVDFTVAGETHKTVDVYDDQTDVGTENPTKLGTAKWDHSQKDRTFTYDLTLD